MYFSSSTIQSCDVFNCVFLASRGFAALALAYFDYEDLPEGFQEIDLDYFAVS